MNLIGLSRFQAIGRQDEVVSNIIIDGRINARVHAAIREVHNHVNEVDLSS